MENRLARWENKRPQWTAGHFLIFPLSDNMDLSHQSSAMCIIILGGEDTHSWPATKVGNPISATIRVDQ